MKKIALILSGWLLLFDASAQVQNCAGGQLMTHQAYQYGRFETRMQSAEGDGIVSSFFLYNIDLGCDWPALNNEIDIEMTGNRNNSVQFTTHYPNLASVTQIVPTGFNPHDAMHVYAFEWEPGIVRWFVDGNLMYMQDSQFVNDLIHPMRIIMNLYAAEAVGWVGEWDPSVLPVESRYDYVSYYAYTPGQGDAGSNNNFTLAWKDHFHSLNRSRWDVTEFGGFGGNYCAFVSANVGTENGLLKMAMTEPLSSTVTTVHFSVDVSALNLTASDTIYLNGGFNGWCGTCNPMTDTDGDGIWELSLVLPAGNHEYLFTRNGWDEIGGAPQGSSCDFLPCDSYTNYGVSVPYAAATINTETYCWGSCNSCAPANPNVCPIPAVDGALGMVNKTLCKSLQGPRLPVVTIGQP